MCERSGTIDPRRVSGSFFRATRNWTNHKEDVWPLVFSFGLFRMTCAYLIHNGPINNKHACNSDGDLRDIEHVNCYKCSEYVAVSHILAHET